MVTGTVKNLPITDAMLRSPDPTEWLMIRHDYHANNYSTLNQITTGNVKDLQLQWVWAMNEGTNQPAPVVHNGILPANNPGNIVQALDAKTGDLIWENRIGDTATGNRSAGSRSTTTRYVTTGAAHIYALDARTGKNVWDTAIGDRTNGNYSTSSGPIIIKARLFKASAADSATNTAKRNVSSARTTPRPGNWWWKFYTIAKTNDPGPESKGPGVAPGATWGSLADTFRAGGDT